MDKRALNCLALWQVSKFGQNLQCSRFGVSLNTLTPQAVLMVGFYEHEIQEFRSVMLDMEADMVKVSDVALHGQLFVQSKTTTSALQIIICDKQMFQQTLRQALEAPGHMHTQVRNAWNLTLQLVCVSNRAWWP